MMLTGLAERLEHAGLTVHRIPGYQQRGKPFSSSPRTIVCHHTAGPTQAAANGRDYPSLGTVRDGRPGIPGPLAQIGIGYSGAVYIIAAGKANHAGRVNNPLYANHSSIGIEAEHPGAGPWPPVQYQAYLTVVKVLMDRYHIPADRVRGHKEICAPRGRKPDPSFDMNQFRTDLVTNHPPDPAALIGEDEMLTQGDRGTPVKQFQRTINGVLYRHARRNGTPPPNGLTVDGIWGPATSTAYTTAHPIAQQAVGVDWGADWDHTSATVLDRVLLLQAVERLAN